MTEDTTRTETDTRSRSDSENERTGNCAFCGDLTVADGERAGVRAGRLLCAACADETLVYSVECLDCDWEYTYEDTAFNWYHIKTRVQQEGNSHENEQQVFEDESHETVWRPHHLSSPTDSADASRG